MTTYNSYAAAKIANPEFAIFERGGLFGTDGDMVDHFDLNMRNYNECNPADHCMTVERFLADGHKFVEGDICLRHDGDVITITESIPDWNVKFSGDDHRFILSAAALEEKPKRMREEYVKVEFEKLSDAALAVDGGDIQFNKYGNQPIDGKALALHYYNTSELSFYLRTEVEVSERDEFIEAYVELAKEGLPMATTDWAGLVFDKLVGGE